MARAIMDLIGDDRRGLSRKRMKWIGDLNLTSQTPGIMTSRRTAVDSVPPRCTASLSRPK
jgi:hypothetical protein